MMPEKMTSKIFSKSEDKTITLPCVQTDIKIFVAWYFTKVLNGNI